MRTIRTATGKQTSVRVGTLNLRAYPAPATQLIKTPEEVMRLGMFGRTFDARQENRKRFGRALSMDRIETALNMAYRGMMRDITDILSETVDTDPHLGSILNKRFGALSALPYEVQPATGQGVDREKAQFYAEVVRAQLKNMKGFRRNIGQLAWALWNGRACLEMNWIELGAGSGPVSPKFGQPRLAVSELEWIHPRRLFFGSQREIRIQPEQNTAGGNFLDVGFDIRMYPDKFIWWLPQLFNEYPEREGLGMRCMYWSFFKRFAARERMVLTELFGKPWRIAEVDPESTASPQDLEDADRIIDSLGATHTARMPRGVKLKIESPAKSAGDVHADIITESDKQNSKLVLGQTGTTDGVPSGLNNNQANVMQDEQLGVLFRDAGLLAEVFESYLCDRIIAVNFGEAEVTHAPTFRLRADLPADRKAELERLQAALNAGLTVSRNEAYEVSGFSIPEAGDIVLRIEQPPTPPNSPVAPAPRPVVVYPQGETPDVGEQQPPTPAAGPGQGEPPLPGNAVSAPDAKMTITVNEDRAARGLEPLTLPSGQPDPRGNLTVAEYEALIAREEIEEDPEEEPALAIAASKKRKTKRVKLAIDVSEDLTTGEELYGDGGIHGHALQRTLLSTDMDGRHVHVFRMPDGSYLFSQFDGLHQHAIASEDEDFSIQDGAHTHVVELPNGALATALADGSSHRHTLQVEATAVDGPHTHVIEISDPENADRKLQVRSMTAGQIAVAMATGEFPEWEGIDPSEMVFTEPAEIVEDPEVTRRETSRKRFERVLSEMKDPRATFDLIQSAERSEHRSAEFASWWAENSKHLLAKQKSTSNGNPDDLISRGMRELVQQSNAWATAFEAAVAGETTSMGIYAALTKARAKLSLDKFGRALERRALHSMMLGVLDNVKEVGDIEAPASDVQAAITKLPEMLKIGLSREAWVTLAKDSDFSKKPFKQALTHFQGLKVLDRPTFERAAAAIKRRSFTVAGILGDQMLQVIQQDLVKAIETGEDLRRFKQRIKPRLEEAGLVGQVGVLKTGAQALNPSHIETVFRTNVLNTYNTGRYVHQTSPAVLAAFPVWQIQGIKDDRTRHTHMNAQGKKLLANDAFWQTAYPPFGFNCRCRVTALPRTALKDVVPGSSISGLPDSGFTSGRPSLAV